MDVWEIMMMYLLRRDIQGRPVIFPNGAFGRGYLIAEETRPKIKHILKVQWGILLLILGDGFIISHSIHPKALGLILVSLFAALSLFWYYKSIYKIIKAFPPIIKIAQIDGYRQPNQIYKIILSIIVFIIPLCILMIIFDSWSRISSELVKNSLITICILYAAYIIWEMISVLKWKVKPRGL